MLPQLCSTAKDSLERYSKNDSYKRTPGEKKWKCVFTKNLFMKLWNKIWGSTNSLVPSHPPPSWHSKKPILSGYETPFLIFLECLLWLKLNSKRAESKEKNHVGFHAQEIQHRIYRRFAIDIYKLLLLTHQPLSSLGQGVFSVSSLTILRRKICSALFQLPIPKHTQLLLERWRKNRTI